MDVGVVMGTSRCTEGTHHDSSNNVEPGHCSNRYGICARCRHDSRTRRAAGHERNIIKDGTATIPPLVECPAPDTTSIDLAFHDAFHLTFTDATFHVTETQTGTFTSRSATGDATGTGHFTTTFSDQGPGFPTESLTSVINAIGKAPDGSQIRVHIAQHFTITPAGDVAVDFTKVSCS